MFDKNDFPTDRDMIVATMKAVFALADKLVPNEQLQVKIVSTAHPDEAWMWTGASETDVRWVPKNDPE